MLSLGGDQKLNLSLEAEREIRGNIVILKKRRVAMPFFLVLTLNNGLWYLLGSGKLRRDKIVPLKNALKRAFPLDY